MPSDSSRRSENGPTDLAIDIEICSKDQGSQASRQEEEEEGHKEKEVEEKGEEGGQEEDGDEASNSSKHSEDIPTGSENDMRLGSMAQGPQSSGQEEQGDDNSDLSRDLKDWVNEIEMGWENEDSQASREEQEDETFNVSGGFPAEDVNWDALKLDEVNQASQPGEQQGGEDEAENRLEEGNKSPDEGGNLGPLEKLGAVVAAARDEYQNYADNSGALSVPARTEKDYEGFMGREGEDG